MVLPLYAYVSLRERDGDPTCWAWLEAKNRTCGREAGPDHLCPMHRAAAERLRAKRTAKDAASRARRAEQAARDLPAARAKLERLEAEYRRLAPEPPTTDMAAYGGVGSTAGRSYQARFSPDRIHRLAVLTDEIARQQSLVSRYEGLAGS